jgi:hypothetical protein
MLTHTRNEKKQKKKQKNFKKARGSHVIDVNDQQALKLFYKHFSGNKNQIRGSESSRITLVALLGEQAGAAQPTSSSSSIAPFLLSFLLQGTQAQRCIHGLPSSH